MDWKPEAERLYRAYGREWSKIAAEMKEWFPDKSHFEAKETIRSYIRSMEKSKQPTSTVVGVIGDFHAPFNHPNYLQFCIDTFKKYRVNQVVCIGDLVDFHALSRHETEPCALGPYQELDRACEQVNLVVRAFPKVKMCRGNHDRIPVRQAATVGLGERFLKSYAEVVGLPKTWEIDDEFIIDSVLYKHGINCEGKDGAFNAAMTERMSTVIGHVHANAGCKYSVNKRDIIFGLAVGCGIDAAAYAFAYGKPLPRRPILGCGIVFNSGNAIFVPMGAEYFRD